MKICTVKDCGKPHKGRGLCDTHLKFFLRTGEIGSRQIKPPAERLWAKVDKTPGQGPNGDCWEWRGYVHPTGYGQMAFDHTPKSGMNTNRIAWIVTNGEIPDGLWVLHRCDNRLCCNPAHLWLGTPKDNTQDMIAKGRRRQGRAYTREDSSLAKLTEEMVRAMRAEPPMKFKDLGEKYGVSAATANKVILRQVWKHVD